MEFEPIWELPIALYLFLAGLGGGAFVTASLLAWKAPETKAMQRAAHIIALVVVGIGLVLLMTDAKAGLLNPLRFVLLLVNFGSVMTWGVVFLAAFMVFDLAVVVLDVLKRAIPTWLQIAGSVSAVLVGMYTGALLGVAHTFPLWNSALLPPLFLVSALSTGAAVVFLYGALAAPREFERTGWVQRAHYFLPVIETVLVASLLFITFYNGDAGHNSVMALVAGKFSLMFWLGFVVIGLVGPLVVETALLFVVDHSFEQTSAGRGVVAATNACVLLGGFLLRYLVVMAALPVTMVVPFM
ncbi:polysulfide reductase NrfD [Berryella wangjianweii]|uniref:Polysulfide reductase NrfD n=1 Tax=Berryella wangjianweii TaxID=2734634 RepID=A0A6M8J250_9ACTN|nr:NrfD/PsrC family molybdoenzyme membrane anchor subunit [Berryella wangjianweii]QKF07637.1 polysulfide reductase NrfD [Berryella wangjianweii]